MRTERRDQLGVLGNVRMEAAEGEGEGRETFVILKTVSRGDAEDAGKTSPPLRASA